MRLTTSDGRFVIANFSLLLIYVWLFTCVRLRFATSNVRCVRAIFSIWDRKNRMTSEFRWMLTEYWEGWNKIRYRKSTIGCRKPHTCVRRLRQSASVLQLPFDVNMWPCDTVTCKPILWAFYGGASSFLTMTFHRYIFHKVTEGYNHCLYKVVTRCVS